MDNILITGGAGFIGSNFVHCILQEYTNSRILVLDKLTYAGNLENLACIKDNKNYRFIKGDINDFALINTLLKDEEIDTIVNFAAESHVDRSILGPQEFITTNINGTFTLLEAAKKCWLEKDNKKDKKRIFLHISTDEVYGSLKETGYFTEKTPYDPNSPYSASKAASDHLVRAYHSTYGLPTVTTNCSNNYGHYQFPEKLIPLILINALKGKPLPVYGDGKNVRDWLYVEDHCRAIIRVLQKGVIGETYNIGGRNEWKNIDIVNEICSVVDGMVSESDELKKRFPFNGSRKKLIEFVKDRPGHDKRYAIDCTKIEQELGWQPEETFETGLRKTIKWYIANQS